ncbi:MAG: M1 family metallopeptidase [Blastochloris sp.]|nr:M1 family metallopeptidase [Blastochloris sp.]
MNAFKIVLLTLTLFLLVGCRLAQSEPLPVVPTATTLRVVQTTPVPTVERALHTLPPAATSVAQAEIPLEPSESTPCEATAGLPGTLHTITADIDYAQHTVYAQQRTRFINRTNEPLAQIVFFVEPNRIPEVFTLQNASLVNAELTAYELTGRRLVLDLAAPLAPGCTAEIDLTFQIAVPAIGTGLAGFTGYFGYNQRQLNLGYWLPTIAVRSGGDWVTHDVIAIGEQVVAEVADWDVTLNIANAPDGLRVAAPGSIERPDSDTWRFQIAGARNFTASMSYAFTVLSQQAANGTMIEIYAFDDSMIDIEGQRVDTAAVALDAAAVSLAMYADLFGDYPFERFVLVQGDFPDGMEFHGFAFVSSDWFRTYTGSPESYLTIITIHEVAHQWWYASVGNDQAVTPWLDEALATYSEYIYYEEYHPELRDWWWRFRVSQFVPANFTGKSVDSTVYEFSSIREYINAVYLRGASMLHQLRDDVGTDAFFAWLRRYAEAGEGRVATPDLFWSLLTDEQRELTRETRTDYLSPDALAVSEAIE